LVQRILERARRRRLRLVDGGRVLVDSTYIDNAADAHLLAADRLAVAAPCAGRAYFITNGEPLPVRELVHRILAAAGIEPVTGTVPLPVAYAAGAAAEAAYQLLRRRTGGAEPPMTRFLARQLGTAHWFDISAARRDLGYRPRVSIDEGMIALRESLRSA
jgi:nucleoside-diphosphate-sugar epimerase